MSDRKPETPKPPRTLYHYCGVEAFHGIVTSKQFWLSNAAFTNDYMEYKWLINKALTLIETKKASATNSTVLDGFADSLQSEKPPYICCFTEGRDMLSQWRAYSDDGEGFSIGYSGKCIQDIISVMEDRHYSVALEKAFYDEDEQQAIVNTEVAKVLNTTKNAYITSIFAAIRLRSRAAVCKNIGFKEEMEWRIVFTPYVHKRKEGEPESDDNVIGPSPLCFRPANRKIIPFFALPFEPDAITTIYLGPKNHARDDHDFLKLFLSENGYDVDRIKIINSAATYR